MKIAKNPRTDVDVALLCDVFPDLLPDGREVTHEQIEAVLRESRLTGRYRRVVSKWRKQLLAERAVYLDGMVAQGRGFVCLAPDEMVRFGPRKARAAGRIWRKAIAVVSLANSSALSDEMRLSRGLFLAAAEKMELVRRSSLRDISRALAPPPQQPKRAIG